MTFAAPVLTAEASETLSLRDKWARAISADRALSCSATITEPGRRQL